MNRRPEPLGKPKFVRFFPSRQTKDATPALNVHMFTEDIARLMPYRIYDGRKSLHVKFHGSDVERGRTLSVLRALTEHSHGSDVDIVCRVVDELAKRVSWEGRAQFELLPCEDGSIFFHSITSVNMVKMFGFAMQFVPAKDRKFWGGKRFRFALSKSLWNVDIPESLGGRWRYIKTLKRLSRFDDLGPPFFRKDITSGLVESRFDQNRYIRANKIFQSRETRQWGWDCRDWSEDRCTEFYNLYRRLTAETAKSIFREYIILELNKLLKRIKIDCTISIDGLLAVSEIEYLKRDLVEGEISFSELLDRISST